MLPVVHREERPLLLGGERGQPAQLVGSGHERLLAEDVDGVLEGGARERPVRRGRRADVDEVEAFGREQLLGRLVPAGVRKLRGEGLEPVRPVVGGRDDVHVAALPPRREVAVDGHVARPDDRSS